MRKLPPRKDAARFFAPSPGIRTDSSAQIVKQKEEEKRRSKRPCSLQAIAAQTCPHVAAKDRPGSGIQTPPPRLPSRSEKESTKFEHATGAAVWRARGWSWFANRYGDYA